MNNLQLLFSVRAGAPRRDRLQGHGHVPKGIPKNTGVAKKHHKGMHWVFRCHSRGKNGVASVWNKGLINGRVFINNTQRPLF